MGAGLGNLGHRVAVMLEWLDDLGVVVMGATEQSCVPRCWDRPSAMTNVRTCWKSGAPHGLDEHTVLFFSRSPSRTDELQNAKAGGVELLATRLDGISTRMTGPRDGVKDVSSGVLINTLISKDLINSSIPSTGIFEVLAAGSPCGGRISGISSRKGASARQGGAGPWGPTRPQDPVWGHSNHQRAPLPLSFFFFFHFIVYLCFQLH